MVSLLMLMKQYLEESCICSVAFVIRLIGLKIKFIFYKSYKPGFRFSFQAALTIFCTNGSFEVSECPSDRNAEDLSVIN